MMFAVLLVSVSVVATSATGSSTTDRERLKYAWTTAFSECLKMSKKIAEAVKTEGAGVVAKQTTDSCVHTSPFLREDEEPDEQFVWTELADCMRLSKMFTTLKAKDEIVIVRVPAGFHLPTYLYRDIQYSLVKEEKSFDEAKEDCKRRGQTLATVENEEERKRITEMVKEADHWLWLGGSDRQKTNHWVWESSGRPLTYTYWLQGDPNHIKNSNGESEHCLGVAVDGKWFDYYCSSKLYYVCSNPTPQLHKKKYTIFKDKKSFDDAKKDCRRRGLRLATVETEEELKRVSKLPKEAGDWFWLGGSDRQKTNHWVWESSGRHLTYTDWLQGDPNHGTDSKGESEHCLGVAYDGKWFDYYCSYALYYVCENLP